MPRAPVYREVAVATRASNKRERVAVPAAEKPLGTIHGINHLVLVCSEMERTLRFYGGILGLKIKMSTNSSNLSKDPYAGRLPTSEWKHFYWMDMGNGDNLALLEVPGMDIEPDSSYFAFLWPGGVRKAPDAPRKMDHLALNVATEDDLRAVRERFLDAGWPVSEIEGGDQVRSIYAYDPDGMPVEIACFFDEEAAYRLDDPDPPPFALELLKKDGRL